jgi:hypothetical protein
MDAANFLLFLPYNGEYEQEAIEADSLDDALEVIKARFIIYSLFTQFEEVPKIPVESVELPSDVTLGQFIKERLTEISTVTVIFLTDMSQLTFILEEVTRGTMLESIMKLRVVFVTKLSKIDFAMFYPECLDLFQLTFEKPKAEPMQLPLKYHEIARQFLSEQQHGIVDYFSNYVEKVKKPLNERFENLQRFIDRFPQMQEFEVQCDHNLEIAMQELNESERKLSDLTKDISQAEDLYGELLADAEEERTDIKPKLENSLREYDQLESEIQESLPKLHAAESFLEHFDTTSLAIIRAVRAPTPSILPFFEAFGILFDVKPVTKIVGENRFLEIFPPVQKVLQDPKLQARFLSSAKADVSLTKIRRLDLLLRQSKNLVSRVIDTNRDFANTRKWFKKLVCANNLKAFLNPIKARLHSVGKIRDLFLNRLSEISENLQDHLNEIEEMKSPIPEVRQEIAKRNEAADRIRERTRRVKLLNVEFEKEVAIAKAKMSQISEQLELSEDTAFVRAISVFSFASLSFTDHHQKWTSLNRQFPDIPIHSDLTQLSERKLKQMGVVGNSVVFSKVLTMLDNLIVPLIYDPVGIALHILLLVVPHSQIVISTIPPKDLQPDAPVIVFLSSIEILHSFLSLPFRFFFFASELPSQESVLNHVVLVNFELHDYSSIFYENLLVAHRPQDYERIFRYEDDIHNFFLKAVQTAESISMSFAADPIEFFEGEIWSNCRNFLVRNASELIKSTQEKQTLDRQLRVVDAVLGDLAEFCDRLLREFLPLLKPKFSAIFPIFLSHAIQIDNPQDLLNRIKAVFRLAIQDSHSTISRDGQLTFPKSPIAFLGGSDKGVQVLSAHNFLSIDLVLEGSEEFRLHHIIEEIPARVPIIIRTTPNNDPTPFLLRQNATVLQLSETYDSSVYRFSGWFIVRFPECLREGADLLDRFIGKLLSIHQFPTDFRLLIIVQKDADIPFSLAAISIQFSYPPILPPSKMFECLVSHVKVQRLSDLQQDNLRRLSNFVEGMSWMVRPTAAVDCALVEHPKFSVFALKSCEMIPDTSLFDTFVDQEWYERMTSGRSKLTLPNLATDSIRLSVAELPNGVRAGGISALDCVWDGAEGRFVRARRFYPVPIADVWIEELEPGSEKCGSVLYGGEPIEPFLRVAVEGGGPFHFLWEC